MKSIFKLFPFVLSATLSAQLSVAVLDFDGIGITKDEARALSSRFGTEFMGVSKGVYKAVEKIQEALKKVDEDLKEVYLSYPVKKLIKSYRVSLPTQHPLSK